MPWFLITSLKTSPKTSLEKEALLCHLEGNAEQLLSVAGKAVKGKGTAQKHSLGHSAAPSWEDRNCHPDRRLHLSTKGSLGWLHSQGLCPPVLVSHLGSGCLCSPSA